MESWLEKWNRKNFVIRMKWNKVTIIKPVEWIINVHSENMKSYGSRIK